MARRLAPTFRGLSPASTATSAIARAGSRKRDTRCELLLRGELWRLGLRYRVAVPGLHGRPDVVFRKAKVAVFVDGDFWHGRDLDARLEKLARGHNAPYWMEKIRSNVARDARVTAALEADGWTVVRLWESEVRADPNVAAKTVLEAYKRRL